MLELQFLDQLISKKDQINHNSISCRKGGETAVLQLWIYLCLRSSFRPIDLIGFVNMWMKTKLTPILSSAEIVVKPAILLKLQFLDSLISLAL